MDGTEAHGAPGRGFVVRPARLLEQMLRQFDTGRDGRITAADVRAARAKTLRLALAPGVELSISGAERLSGLADLLGRECRRGRAEHAILPVSALAPTRLDAALEMVSHGWELLERRVDGIDPLLHAIREGILQSADGGLYVYVPERDEAAFAKLLAEGEGRRNLVLVRLPRRRGRRWQALLDAHPGVAYLPRPYLVPGGHFTELYGWDSYFLARGALADDRVAIARDIAENLAYEMRYYGKIPNTNRSYHLSRTQPPLLAGLALQVWTELERRGDREAPAFLRRMVRAIEAGLQQVWRRAPRHTETGLARYHDEAEGPCPEVDAAFYRRHPQTVSYWRHDRAQRESGWDLTHRFGEEAHLHLPVCLNALLYRVECDLAELHRRADGADSERARLYERRAARRRRLADRHLWDERAGMYFDWSMTRRARTGYESLATFYPLWTGMASTAQAARVAENTERFLEAGGLATSSERSRRQAPRERFQWDWPVGWAPLQIIAVEGLRRYGFDALADRVAYRWLHMVLRIAGRANGLIVEKYDVVQASAEVSAAEYRNQGGDRGPHRALEAAQSLGFGWTNASIPLLLAGLSERLQLALESGLSAERAGL